jgi:hypothetical protein
MLGLMRTLLLALASLSCAVLAQPAPEPLFQLLPNGRPVMLERYTPAGGPLQRFTARPGAWYVTLFLAAPPQWPVEFTVVPRTPSHELRVFALDTTPTGEVNSIGSLPMVYSPPRHGQPAHYTGDFVLPAYASLDGITLVLEQWSLRGDAPPAIWVHSRFTTGRTNNGNGAAWWSPKATRAPGATAPALVGPPSPLLSQGERRGVYEIPMQQIPASPLLDPYSAR